MPVLDDLSAFPSLAALDREELRTLARAGHEVAFPAGHRVIQEGQPADRCWLIRGGQVRLDARVGGYTEIVLQTLHRGDLLGWSWLVPPYRWHFGALATEAVEAVEFDATALNRLSADDPRFGRALLLALTEVLVVRLQATRARLIDVYRNPADKPWHPSCGGS
ncbi:cyclic nucleotide-binding domain-containing protein [Nocardia grenadensis]|uniref:cyclic nucleotide-binding domain-containing protein n=1 Tax=Nocardia grenadensis TaxID=931537 RepID=UPI000A01448C|nr:cyclic nucleotide-binding domain-containing protein [Nocardia grenadensis]